MNKLGISSACYYPLVTEKSLRKAGENGIRCAELFINSPSELSKPYVEDIAAIKRHYGMDIISVHPFMSFAESYFLFSSYKRRFYDILDLYRQFFETAQKLGAEIFVVHGSKIPGSISDEEYFERFSVLMAIGKSFGINICQENVVGYRSQNIDFMERMQHYIGSDFGMVLDIKQARRTGISACDFAKKLHGSIKHIHISDYDSQCDCIPPGEGKFDFRNFFDIMKSYGYTGAYIIELYEHSYKKEEQIYRSYEKIGKILIDY